MTVAELRAALDAYPADLVVSVQGYESGYTDLTTMSVEKVVLNGYEGEWYFGEHRAADTYNPAQLPDGQGERLVLWR